MFNYDVLIPCATKDYIKLPYCIEGLKNLNPQPDNIFVVSKDRINIPGVTWVYESTVLPFDTSYLENMRYDRPKWIYQQLIKIGQDVTQNNYFAIDSDVILLKEFEISPNKFFISSDQYHRPYFNLMKQVLGIDKKYNFSFISDMMLFDRVLCNAMTGPIDKFADKIIPLLDDDNLFGDYEWYPCFVDTVTQIEIRKISMRMCGKYLPQLFTGEEICDIIENSKSLNYDAVAIHSWS